MRPVQAFDSDHGIEDALQIVALRRVLQALLIRLAPRIREIHVSEDLPIVAKLRACAMAFAFRGFRVGCASAGIY